MKVLRFIICLSLLISGLSSSATTVGLRRLARGNFLNAGRRALKADQLNKSCAAYSLLREKPTHIEVVPEHQRLMTIQPGSKGPGTYSVTYRLPDPLLATGGETIEPVASANLAKILHSNEEPNRLDQRRFESSAMVNPSIARMMEKEILKELLFKLGGTSGVRPGTPPEGYNYLITGVGKQFSITDEEGSPTMTFRIRTRGYGQVIEDRENHRDIIGQEAFKHRKKLEVKAKDLLASDKKKKCSFKMSVVASDKVIAGIYRAFDQQSGVRMALEDFRKNALDQPENDPEIVENMVSFLEVMWIADHAPTVNALICTTRAAQEITIPGIGGADDYKLQWTIDRNIKPHILMNAYKSLWDNTNLDPSKILILPPPEIIRMPHLEEFCVEAKRPIIEGNETSEIVEDLITRLFGPLKCGGKVSHIRKRLFQSKKPKEEKRKKKKKKKKKKKTSTLEVEV